MRWVHVNAVKEVTSCSGLLLDGNVNSLVLESLRLRRKAVFKAYLRWRAVLRGYRKLMRLFSLTKLDALDIASFLTDEVLEGLIYGKDYEGEVKGLPWEALYHDTVMR